MHIDVVALTSLCKVARMFATAKWIANDGRESLRPEIKDEGQGAVSFYPDAACHAPRTHASEVVHTLILVQANTTDGAGHVISLPHRTNLRTAFGTLRCTQQLASTCQVAALIFQIAREKIGRLLRFCVGAQRFVLAILYLHGWLNVFEAKMAWTHRCFASGARLRCDHHFVGIPNINRNPTNSSEHSHHHHQSRKDVQKYMMLRVAQSSACKCFSRCCTARTSLQLAL